MTPLPVPTPEEYRRYPLHVLERWEDVVWRAGRHDEAAVIRREIEKRNQEEIAA